MYLGNYDQESEFKSSSFLMPLADIPNHQFSSLNPDHPNFEESGKFGIVPEEGYVGFKVNKVFNQGVEEY